MLKSIRESLISWGRNRSRGRLMAEDRELGGGGVTVLHRATEFQINISGKG